MTSLVTFLARGVVSQPDAVSVNAVEGEASVVYELAVAPQDIAAVRGPEGATLSAIRAVVSASAGRRKAVVELVDGSASDAADSEE